MYFIYFYRFIPFYIDSLPAFQAPAAWRFASNVFYWPLDFVLRFLFSVLGADNYETGTNKEPSRYFACKKVTAFFPSSPISGV